LFVSAAPCTSDSDLRYFSTDHRMKEAKLA
jgi:hypothetical protein